MTDVLLRFNMSVNICEQKNVYKIQKCISLIFFFFFSAIFVFSYVAIFVIRSIAASRKLHNTMLHSVIRSPMSFFDTTPIGRIVNRFSADIDTIDNELPMTVEMWLDTAFLVVATMVVISYSTPYFIIMIVPFSVLYFLVQVSMITWCRHK